LMMMNMKTMMIVFDDDDGDYYWLSALTIIIIVIVIIIVLVIILSDFCLNKPGPWKRRSSPSHAGDEIQALWLLVSLARTSPAGWVVSSVARAGFAHRRLQGWLFLIYLLPATYDSGMGMMGFSRDNSLETIRWSSIKGSRIPQQSLSIGLRIYLSQQCPKIWLLKWPPSFISPCRHRVLLNDPKYLSICTLVFVYTCCGVTKKTVSNWPSYHLPSDSQTWFAGNFPNTSMILPHDFPVKMLISGDFPSVLGQRPTFPELSRTGRAASTSKSRTGASWDGR
jgi:hypothetical protein